MIRGADQSIVAGMTTTHTTTPDCQVLVVGAGPTGLTLAAQLLARGIHARVIDKGEGPAPQNRAVAIHARTLELLDTMGLADAFIDQGHREAVVLVGLGLELQRPLNVRPAPGRVADDLSCAAPGV